MNRYVAFLRAINVAGHATVKMADLKEAFVAAGCSEVRTYIQSGNVIFDSPARNSAAVLQKVRMGLRERLGENPGVAFRTAEELEDLVAAAPFREFEGEAGLKLYVAFLLEEGAITPKFPLVSSKEALEIVGMAHLQAFLVSRRKPSGFYGIPNLFVEKELGVLATSRNWSTVTKITKLLKGP